MLKKIIVVIGVLLGLGFGDEQRENVFTVFTGYYPSSWTQIGQLQLGTQIQATVSTTLPNLNISFVLHSGTNILSAIPVQHSVSVNPYTYHLQTTITETQNYWIQIITSDHYYIECILKVQVNGITTVYNKQNIFYNTVLPVHKITVEAACRIKLRYRGPILKMMKVYDEEGAKRRTHPVALIKNNEHTLTIPKSGNYYLIIQQAFPALPQPYSVEMTTYYSSSDSDSDSLSLSPLDQQKIQNSLKSASAEINQD